MIGILPELYPDELVYSWFCRYYIYSGSLTHSAALRELLCKRCNNPSKEFIGYLSDDTKDEIERRFSMDGLILRHTMFPQYARFISLERRKNAMNHLKNDYCDAHKLFTILPRGSGEQYLRYCPVCAAKDREQYGETYWHRKHQIRNMRICQEHRCRLIDSTVSAKSEQTYVFYPAENYVFENTITRTYNQSEIKFAEYMEKIFDAPISFKNDTPVSAILYHAMHNTKYISSSGKTRCTKQLFDDLTIYYNEIGLKNIASINQIQRTLLEDSSDFSVVCQIAFFLKISVQDLVSPALTEEQMEQERNSHYMKNSLMIDWKKYDEEMVQALESYAKSVYFGDTNEMGRPERLSEKMIYRKFNLPKHRLDNMPRCRAVFEKYTESYGENYARRIVWAYLKLRSEKKDGNVYWSDVRSLSGVKKSNFHAAIPYLTKYADENTVNTIIDIAG